MEIISFCFKLWSELALGRSTERAGLLSQSDCLLFKTVLDASEAWIQHKSTTPSPQAYHFIPKKQSKLRHTQFFCLLPTHMIWKSLK